MPEHTQRDLNRALISQQDLKNAAEYFDAAMRAHQSGDHLVCRGLITAGIVAYARPFSGNAPHESANPRPQLSRKSWSATERELHDRIVQLRNTVVAHSDAAHIPVQVEARTSRSLIYSATFHAPLAEAGELPAMFALAKKTLSLLAFKPFVE